MGKAQEADNGIPKTRDFRVGLPGLEPGTSSLSEKHDVLLEVLESAKCLQIRLLSALRFSRVFGILA